MEPPSQKQLDELAEMLLPLFRRLAGAQPSQDVKLNITATSVHEAVTLRMNLKVDGQDLPAALEERISLFLGGVWENYRETH